MALDFSLGMKVAMWTLGAIQSLGVWLLMSRVFMFIFGLLSGIMPVPLMVFLFVLVPVGCYVYFHEAKDTGNNIFWKLGRWFGAIFFREWSCDNAIKKQSKREVEEKEECEDGCTDCEPCRIANGLG